MNELLQIDLSATDGYRTGDLLQKLLMEMCRGNNFDWKYSTSAEDQAFNQKVIQRWHKAWAQVEGERRAWILLGKLTEDEAAEFMAQFEGREAAPEKSGKLEDF